MKEAVIISTARTPIGKAYRGAFNNTESPTLGGHVVKMAVDRAGIEIAEIDDVIMGCAMQQGSQSANIGRMSALAAGLPATVSGMSIDRQCSSGMMAIATAAKQIICDGMQIVIGGGVESISLVQNEHMNRHRVKDPNVLKVSEHAYMPMLQTAEVVARRYNISREAQDEYSVESQARTAAAQEAGKFDDELVPLDTVKGVMDKATKAISFENVRLMKDEGNRPGTDRQALSNLNPVIEGGFITAEMPVSYLTVHPQQYLWSARLPSSGESSPWEFTGVLP